MSTLKALRALKLSALEQKLINVFLTKIIPLCTWRRLFSPR